MDVIERTLFVHCKPAQDDGVIRFDCRKYTYKNLQGKLSGKRMKVLVVESPHDFHTLTHRLLVYNKPIASDETFIGCADYREPL